MDIDELLKEFCKEQSGELYYGGVRKRKSILLQIKDDIDYNLGFPGFFRDLELSREQQARLDKELAPLFVVPLLYCSAVDLIARVNIKRSRPRRSGAAFKESSKIFFGYDNKEAETLWKFRNSLSHQYSIRDYVISKYGGRKVIQFHGDNHDRIVICVRVMRKSLDEAIDNLYDYLLNESDANKAKTGHFIKKYGFQYYLVV